LQLVAVVDVDDASVVVTLVAVVVMAVSVAVVTVVEVVVGHRAPKHVTAQ
jgi:hypothetical protein